MKITDIKVTPENHSQYNLEYHEWNKQKCLDAHTTLNEFLDNELGSMSQDWGGQYASFLDRMGIDSNSENGWWSIDAVRHENIEAFIDFKNDEIFSDKYHKAHKKIKNIKGFKHSYNNVRELINAI